LNGLHFERRLRGAAVKKQEVRSEGDEREEYEVTREGIVDPTVCERRVEADARRAQPAGDLDCLECLSFFCELLFHGGRRSSEVEGVAEESGTGEHCGVMPPQQRSRRHQRRALRQQHHTEREQHR
jgi:hypothetical protein